MRLRISGGVLAGASTAHQAGASKPGRPLSASVGTSGSSGRALAGGHGQRAQPLVVDVRLGHEHRADGQLARARPPRRSSAVRHPCREHASSRCRSTCRPWPSQGARGCRSRSSRSSPACSPWPPPPRRRSSCIRNRQRWPAPSDEVPIRATGTRSFLESKGRLGISAGLTPCVSNTTAIGVAVGRCRGHRGGADGAGGAALVLHDHGLAELLRQRLCQQARHLVDRAAGREHRHQLDRLLARPGLGERRGERCGQQRGDCGGQRHASGQVLRHLCKYGQATGRASLWDTPRGQGQDARRRRLWRARSLPLDHLDCSRASLG